MRWDPQRFARWLRRYAWVPGPGGAPVKLVPNKGQARSLVELPALKGVAGLYPCPKGRQAGFTTWCLLFVGYLCAEHPGISCLVMTPNEEPIGMEVLARWRRLLQLLGHHGVAVLAGPMPNNKNETGFSNGSRVSWHHVGGTATVADSVGRSTTLDFVLATEFAFPHEASLLAIAMESLEPALERAGAPMVLDSTPGVHPGTGTPFVDYIELVLRGELPGSVFFQPWWEVEASHHRHALSVPHAQFAGTVTEEERGLIRAHGLSYEQLAWRRSKLAKGGPRKFRKAYPESLADVLMASDASETLFDPDVMSQLRSRGRGGTFTAPLPWISAKAAIPLALKLPRGVLDLLTLAKWRKDPNELGEGYCRVWRLPEASGSTGGGWRGLRRARRQAYAGIDTSDGKPGSDWQVCTVIDEHGRLCAVLRVRVDPARFAALCQRLLEWYGAMSVIEAPHGALVHRFLTGCYQWSTWGECPPPGATEGEIAVLERACTCELRYEQTTTSNRPQIMSAAMVALEAPGGCPDAETLKEMEDLYRDPRGKIVARAKRHDDLILSRGLAEYLRVRVLERALDPHQPRGRARGRAKRSKYDYLR